MDVVDFDGVEDGLHLLDLVEVEHQLPVGTFLDETFRNLVLQNAENRVKHGVGAKAGVDADEQVAAHHFKDSEVGGDVFLDDAQVEGIGHLDGLVVDKGERHRLLCLLGQQVLNLRERNGYQMFIEKRPMYGFFSEDGKMLGYYSLAKQSDTEWELNNLCVLPEHRHDGIGDQLLQDAFNRVREFGAAKLNIGIVEENVRLRKWYESKGFMHTGTKKFDFFPFTCGYMEKAL